MLGRLVNYFVGGVISGAQDAQEESNNEVAVMPRLSQVEVEGDGWILIDRIVEGATTLEESWYVTPPACFTRAGPVNVETSPLENLLIEHPSMSVYRATAFPIAPDTPPPTPDAPEDRDAEEDVLPSVVSGAQAALSAERSQLTRPVNNREVRRPSIRDGRPTVSRARTEKRTAQSRSAQKVLEKRSTQSWKRGHLERSNKLTEVFSVKGRRPRRQDRLRVQNSGANNNRKC
ncbi:tumor protein p53 inducible nuclear protein isoform X2 [Colletes latitarsis]